MFVVCGLGVEGEGGRRKTSLWFCHQEHQHLLPGTRRAPLLTSRATLTSRTLHIPLLVIVTFALTLLNCHPQRKVLVMNATLNVYSKIFSTLLQTEAGVPLLDKLKSELERKKVRSVLESMKQKMEKQSRHLGQLNLDREDVLSKLGDIKVGVGQTFVVEVCAADINTFAAFVQQQNIYIYRLYRVLRN